MDSYKYLAKNIGLLAISQFGTKILAFFLVPLYTNVLTTGEYGTYDLFSSTAALLVPILTFNISTSTLRYTLEKEFNKRAIFTISCKYLFLSSMLLVVFLIGNHIYKVFSIIDDYKFFFFVMFFSQAMSEIISNFARGLEKIYEVAVSALVASIVLLLLNIILIVIFRLGLTGYFIANIVSTLSQGIYILLRIKCWRFFDIKLKINSLEQQMLNYSKPMIANSVAWWINSAADKYIILVLCGVAENGIYSVASKIPSLLNIFQTIFNQAWSLSAIKDFDSQDKNGFFSKMYNSYNCLMSVACAGLILLNRFLAKILYAKDFFTAWKYVPFLLIAIMFGALSGYVGGIYTAVKETKIFAQSTVIGALVNIGINLIIVPVWGALGAAFATAISYWTVWLLRMFHMKKYLIIKLNLFRDYVVYLLLLLQSILYLLFVNDFLGLYIIQFIIILIIISLFSKEIRFIIKTGIKEIKNKINTKRG